MPWLLPREIAPLHQKALDRYLGSLTERLSDPNVDRNALVREELARLLYGRPYEELLEANPLAAMGLDPEGITFEAEYYAATDLEKFRRVKPLLWFWKVLDLTPLGQSVHSGVAIRRALAPFIFKRVGKNPKFFQNVEFSVGYNLELGDDVVVHRYVFLDDIGGIKIGDAVADVMDAGTAAGEETADRGIGLERLEEFHFRATEVEMDDLGSIGLLGSARRHLQDVTIEAKCGVYVLDRDADMRNSGLHAGSLA